MGFFLVNLAKNVIDGKGDMTSVVAVTTHILFESDTFGGAGQPSKPTKWLPVPNGLFDARMGSTDPAIACPTCGKKGTKCLGHFGHIPLSQALFQGKLKRLPVPPPVCRPFRRSHHNVTHHKLTHQLSEILVLNQRVKSKGSKRLEKAVTVFLYTWLLNSIRV